VDEPRGPLRRESSFASADDGLGWKSTDNGRGITHQTSIPRTGSRPLGKRCSVAARRGKFAVAGYKVGPAVLHGWASFVVNRPEANGWKSTVRRQGQVAPPAALSKGTPIG